MSDKFTPGPWHWSANPHGGARVEAPGIGIADVLSRAGVPHPVQGHCIANARLIAAAPDLLEACEAAQKELNAIAGYSGAAGNWPLQDALEAVRAAIAKARGGSDG